MKLMASGASPSLRDYLKAYWASYAQSAVRAGRSLVRSPLTLVAACLIFAALLFVPSLFAPLGRAGGILAALFRLVLISIYFGWLVEFARDSRPSVEDIFRIEYDILSAVMTAGFLLYIAYYMAQAFGNTPGVEWVGWLIGLGIFILFNTLPEVLIVRGADGMSALRIAFSTTIEYWIEWFLPLVVLLSPVLLLGSTASGTVLMLMAQCDPILPAMLVTQVWSSVTAFYRLSPFFGLLVGCVVAHWYMLFRLYHFQELDGAKIRQRVYRARAQ